MIGNVAASNEIRNGLLQLEQRSRSHPLMCLQATVHAYMDAAIGCGNGHGHL